MQQIEIYLQQVGRFGIKPGLERIQWLLERAQNPHQNYPVILVGGTNGKGSTSEFLARVLAQNGLRVGLYTSPHLYKWNERIRVIENRKPKPQNYYPFPDAISDEELQALFSQALPLFQQSAANQNLGQPTEFEVLTLLGLWHFARASVDAAVVEVGLGGKWDATNITQPLVSVVTHVALDHCDRLGNTHVEIARDKVEIARAGRVLVTAETRDDVMEVFRDYCDQIGAKLWPLRQPQKSNDPENFKVALQNLPLDLRDLNEETPFQTVNAATAALALQAFSQEQNRSLTWTTPLLQVPGRMEEISQHPLVLLDGANNPDGAQHAAQHLIRVLKERRQTHPNARLILILGISADKDFRHMIQILAPLADEILATQSTSLRAAPANVIAQETRQFCPNVEIHTPPQAALNAALHRASTHDVICVTGSFFNLADIKRRKP